MESTLDHAPRKTELARQWPGREVLLTDGGHREENDPITTSVGCHNDLIPLKFRQISYDDAYHNGCVWLAACLLIHTVDTDLSHTMIKRYEESQKTFEWMDLFKKKKRKRHNMECYTEANLYDQLLYTKGNKYQLQRVRLWKDCMSKDITEMVVEELQEGMFVAILQDKNGGSSHAVGVDASKKLIYDCLEERALPLNKGNLSICCGINKEFNRIKFVGQIKMKDQKKEP